MIKKMAVKWRDILLKAIFLWFERNAFSYAGSLAFYTLFSLAPTFIIAVTVIGMVFGEDAARGQLVAQLQDVIGPGAATAIEQAVSQSRIETSGLMPTLMGIAALLIGATTVFAQMQYSLNAIWGVTASPNQSTIMAFLKVRLLSLAVVLVIGFVLLVSVILGIMLRAIFVFARDWLPGGDLLLISAESLLFLLVIALLFAAVFKVLPDIVIGWKDVIVGALVSAILFSIGRHAIAAYLAYTATASTYGAAGSVVLILLWVYYSSLILMFGAAFTRTHMEARGREIVPRNMAVRIRQQLVTDGEEPLR